LRLDSAAGGVLDVHETRSRLWIPIIHDVLEMRNDYFSMNDGIVKNERPTTHPISRSRKGGHALGNGKTSVLVEPGQFSKYITSIYIPRR